VALLQAFVAGRRGLRLGSLFGAPAVFAGRRVAIRIDGDAIDVRLAPAGRDFANGGAARTCRGRTCRLAPPPGPA
jgi:hypothetical protein